MRYIAAILLVIVFPITSHALEMPEPEIATRQQEASAMPVGERVALWAEKFVGTPYDPDPLGEYVTRQVVVADERVDCMYLTFRSVELALSGSPDEAHALALDKRFKGKGIEEDGRVINYGDRFQYAVDMLRSGKWGTDITPDLPGSVEMEGSRGIKAVTVLPREAIPAAYKRLRSGDMIFFVKDPSKRVVGEIIGHIGIIKREGEELYLIHASGRKNRDGKVMKVLFADYIGGMPFAGIMAGRF